MTRDLDSLENFNYLWDDVWLIQQQEEEDEQTS
jgi:hypothetical protein